MERIAGDGKIAEEEIQKIFRKVPAEIAALWERRTEELPVVDQLAEVRRLYALREKKTHTFSEKAQSPSSGEVVHTSPLAVRRLIEQVEKGAHEYLGEGKSARVIASIRNPGVCYKVFFPANVQPIGTNSISLEAEMQNAVGQVGEQYGVRAPKYHYYIANETVRAIAMERLNAVSIIDVLMKKEVLPASFTIDLFFSALEQYMSMLNERGIYHRDLHGGNVLIDKDTAMPYVIDFGHATKSIGGDEEVYKAEVVRSGRKLSVVLLSDPAQVQQLKADMQKYIRVHQELV